MTCTTKTLGLALFMAAGTANASVWSYEWNRPDSAIAFTDDAGAATSLKTTYDDVAGKLTWEMTWSDTVTDGMSIMLTHGETPSEVGKYAVLFVEPGPSAGGNPNELSVRANMLGYNASADASTSVVDGDALQDGNQTPDHIATTEYGDQSWFQDALVIDAGGMRTLRFTVYTELIDAHTPLHGEATGWSGFAFGENLGISARTYSGVGTGYDLHGYLTSWNANDEGIFEGSFIPTVPAPGAAGALAFGVAAARRRRR